MTTETLSPVLRQKFWNSNGQPLVDGKVFTYVAGTNNKRATYSDPGGLTPNTNPVILDYRGEAPIYIPPNVSYKFVVSPKDDTDPPTNPIMTIDEVVNSQLLTLYGGVDTGSANAYVLDFTASFSAYEDGIVIYWLPSHTNTGASTVNVNGLGPVSILNQNGGVLNPGQIRQNQMAQMIFQGTGFRLLSLTLLPIVFGATRTTSQNLAASTINTIIFDSNVDNPQANYNLATGVFTAPETGTYFFSVSLLLQNDSAGNGVFNGAYLSKNDNNGTPGQIFYLSGFVGIGETINAASAAIPTVGTVSIPLVAADTVRVKVNLGAGFGGGGSFHAKATSYFSGARVA